MKTKSKSIFNIFTLFALLASLIGSAAFVTPAYAAEDYVVNTTRRQHDQLRLLHPAQSDQRR